MFKTNSIEKLKGFDFEVKTPMVTIIMKFTQLNF